MKRIAFSCLLLCVMTWACSGCGRGPVLQVGPMQKVALARIEGDFLIVTGEGRPGVKRRTVKLAPEEKILVMRAARMDALRNTLRELDLVETVTRGSYEYERVKGVVRGARVLREEWLEPHGVRVTLKVPLNGAGSLADGLGYRKIIPR